MVVQLNTLWIHAKSKRNQIGLDLLFVLIDLAFSLSFIYLIPLPLPLSHTYTYICSTGEIDHRPKKHRRDRPQTKKAQERSTTDQKSTGEIDHKQKSTGEIDHKHKSTGDIVDFGTNFGIMLASKIALWATQNKTPPRCFKTPPKSDSLTFSVCLGGLRGACLGMGRPLGGLGAASEAHVWVWGGLWAAVLDAS